MSHADATIAVRVLLFASYAERLGLESVDVRVPQAATVREVLDHVRALPGGKELPARPLCALNLAHVSLDHSVAGGDEIALLPPLAGG
jgi:molybdopterin synthase sulfur carrier subunit